ncbi:MAG: SemiSWEET family transporter [Candidatus Omnitrophica bacterium]|nr:SemiSWEET family transporter [Candidatus Omnitrophota bacterium]
MLWEFIGFAAATLTMFSFIPQIIKVIKIKSSHDVSLITLIQLSAGVSLWIIYGLHLRSRVIIVANAATLLSLLVLLFLYFLYRKGKMRL